MKSVLFLVCKCSTHALTVYGVGSNVPMAYVGVGSNVPMAYVGVGSNVPMV